MIQYTKIVNSLSSTVPFVGPETLERKMDKIFDSRIGANESVFGPSKLALKAMKKELKNIWMYGDPENFDLKMMLSKIHNISYKNIIVGEGIDNLLSYFVRLFVESGINVVTTDGAYPTFNYHVIGFGGTLHKVNFRNDYEDPELLINEVKKTKARVVYISNPNNPMGTFQEGAIIAEFVNLIPDYCIVCLDEAYSDFIDTNKIPKISIDKENVIRMRTFSKAYGMAGGRCGYAIGHESVIESFNKIRNHFGVNRVTQVGAMESLKDRNHLKNVLKKVEKSKQEIYRISLKNNLKPLKSFTNFVAIDCLSDETFANSIMKELLKKGIFVRKPLSYPQNRCIRVSVGNKKDMLNFERALSNVLSDLRK